MMNEEVNQAIAAAIAAIEMAEKFPADGEISAAVEAVAKARAAVVAATKACAKARQISHRDAWSVAVMLHGDDSITVAREAIEELCFLVSMH